MPSNPNFAVWDVGGNATEYVVLGVSLNPSADLAITKTNTPAAGPNDQPNDTLTPGQTTTYQLVVTNNGPDPVTGAVVTDTPGANLNCPANNPVTITGNGVPTAPAGGFRVSHLTAGIALGNLNNTQTTTLSFSCTVAAAPTGVNVVNNATVTAPAGVTEANLTNNTANDTDRLPSATLTLVKTVDNTGGGTAAANAWTLAAAGPTSISGTTGAAAVTNVVVQPGNYTLSETGGPADYLAPDGWDCGAIPVTNGQITLAAGNAATCTINNTFVQRAEINLRKIATPDVVNAAGDVVTYTFQAINNGNVPLTNLTVTDPFLPNLGACTPTTVAAGATVTLTCAGNTHTVTQAEINARGNATPPDGFLHNQAIVAGTAPDGSIPTDADSATVQLPVLDPQLSIAKQATPTAFAVGNTGTYTLQVSNAAGGGSTTGAITVSDPLPAGITSTGTPTGTGWSCSVAANVVTCTTNAVLTPGASAPVISVPVTVGAAAANPSVNTATVTGGGDPVCTAGANPMPAQCQGTTTTTVNAPRLDLVKTSAGNFTVGNPASYTIVVTNNGQAATSAAATVVDNVPANLTIGTPLPNGCTANGQAVSCNIPAGLAIGGQASFTVTVTPTTAANGQQVTNTASVTGGGDPTCTVPPAATLAAHCQGTTTNTVSAPELHLAKTATPTSFTVGEQGSYTLTVTNQGTAPTAGNTTVTDTVPTGLTIGTPLPANCTANGQLLSCTVGALGATNGTATITIPVTAQQAVDGQTVQNAARVTGGGDPGCTATTNPLPARCQAQVPVPVVSPALHVAKTASTASFSIGVAASYTIKVTNVGTVETQGGWTVTDVVPGGLTIGTSLPNGCTASGQQVTCTSSAILTAGDTTGVSFVIPVTPTAAAVPSVTNTATVQGGGDPHCPMPNNANCTSTITTPVNSPSLAVTKAATPATFAVGQQGSYTLTVRNQGQAATVGAVTVLDTLPAGITLAADPTTSNGWSCTANGGATVTCTSAANLNLAVDATSTITLNVNVGAAAVPGVTNRASVGGGGDPFNGGTPPTPDTCTDTAPAPNHCAQLDTPVTPVADMQATSPVTLATTVGVQATIQSSCTNNGPNAAAAPTCEVTGIPQGANPVTTCTPNPAPDPLAVGGTISCTTTFTPVDTTPITVTTTAGSSTQDPDPNNNVATTPTTTGVVVNLAITKTATPNGTYQPNGAISYSIVVTNNGPSAAVGATVNDVVPNAVAVTGWTCAASAGGACTASGTGNTINDTVNIPVGGTVTYTINGTVANAATGDIVNTATATPPAGATCTTPPCAVTSTATNTNAGNPQLAIAKQATPTAFAVNATGTYTLQVTNGNAQGSSSTNGAITVSDPLPAGITTTGTPTGAGWNCAASTATQVTCTTNAVLTPGASAPVISVPVAIGQNAANPSVNTATVTGGGDPVCTAGANPMPAQCQGTTTTTVNAPRLDLVKTSAGGFTVGSPASYTIVVTNNGQAATSAAATVTDNIPAGLTIGTPLPNGCTANGQAVSCDIPAGLAIGGQASFTVTVTPTQAVNGQQVTNTANVTGGGDPTCTVPPAATLAAHCQSTTTNTVSAPELHLSKTSTPAAFVVGQAGSYNLKVVNSGTAATSGNIVVSDTIPTGLTIGTPLPAGCTANGQQISCTITQVLGASNGTTTFTIPVTATAAVDGQTVQNAATVIGGGDPVCTATTNPLPARCLAQVPVPVQSPALHVEKTASTASFSIGVAASYTIKVTNVGTVESTGNWTVTDVIPGGLTIGTPLPSGCTASGQQVTCTSNVDLQPGDTTGASFVIPVTPTAAAVPSVTNTATVQGGGDPHCPMPNNANCTSTITTQVNAEADMQATAPQTIATTVGVQATIQSSCTNNGPNPAAAPTCEVTGIPAGANPVTTCTPNPLPANLAVGATIDCTTTFTPADTTPITAVTTAGSTTQDPNPNNNVANTTTTPVVPQTDMQATAPLTLVTTVGVQATIQSSCTNNGPNPAAAPTCEVTGIPAGANPVTTCTPNPLPATLAVGEVIDCTTTFTPVDTTPITAVTTAGSTTPDSNPNNNVANTITTPAAAPQTDMQATAPQTIATTVGVQATIQSSCTNNGPNPAAAPTCTVTGIPAGANPVTTCTPNPLPATLAVGDAIDCTTTFTPVDTTPITAVTTAGSTTPDSNPNNNVANTTTTAGVASLSITKQATPTAFAVGNPGTYTLQVSNAAGGGSTTGTITVSDPLPAGITSTGTPTGAGWNCSASTATQVTCTTSAVLTPGASAPVISVPVAVGAAAANPSVNTATVTGGGDPVCTAGANPMPAQCQGTTTTTVNAPRLDLVKTLNGPLTVGNAASYTIVVTNNGQAATSAAATVTDNIPAGLAIGTPLPNGCTANGQAVSCTIQAGLAIGGQASFTVTVTPDDTVNGQQVSNTASVTGGGDPTCPAAAHCNGTTTGTVSAPELHLAKTANPVSFTVGEQGTYTLTVANQGTAATTGNTTVTDTVPAGLTIGTLPANCTANGQQLSCAVGVLGATNGTATITIPVTAQQAVDGQTVQNAARVTGGGDPGCTATTSPLPARCQAQVPVPVVSPALHVVKTASTASFSIGVAASYTIKVANVGTVETDGDWTVTDVIPGGLTIGTPLPDGCTASGQQVTCTSDLVLAAGGSGVSFVIPVTPTAAAVPSVTNTATVQGGGDPHCPMPNNANCTSTITTPVNAQADMAATGPTTVPATVGQPVSVTTSCTNNGPDAAANATCTVTGAPAGATTVCTPTPPVGSLANGQAISCVTTFTPADTALVTLTTTAGSTTTDPNPDNNVASTPVQPALAPTADMTATAPTTVPATVGQPVSVTTSCTNNGPNAAANATCAVTGAPAGATTVCTPTTPVAGLASGQAISCVTTFTPADTTPVTLTTTAGSATTDPNPDNNVANTTVQPGVTPTADMAATAPTTVPATVGQPVSVTTNCTNNGPGAAANATCAVTGAPAGATTVCTPTPPVASLANGQAISCVTTFTPADATPVTLTTTAGSTTADPNPGNNVANTTVQPVAPGSVTVRKTLNAGTVTPVIGGQAIAYDLTATNAGSTAVSDHAFFEVVPTNTTYSGVITGATTNCAAGAAAGSVCTVTLANVPANGTATASITFTAVNPMPEGVVSIANMITDNTRTAPAGCPIPMDENGMAKSGLLAKAGETTPMCPRPLASTCDAASAAAGHCVQTPVKSRNGSRPVEIPVDGWWMLALLSLLLCRSAAVARGGRRAR
ncbi:DUF7507 domain-containing protein [Comamonas humi]